MKNLFCHRQPLRHWGAFSTAMTLAAMLVLMLGCGGGPMADEALPAASVNRATAAAGQRAEPADPADHAARTRQGRYLSAEEARALAERLDQHLVSVDASCCGPEAAELDALIAFGMQAAGNLPREAPFVVSGADARQAAALANRLADLGAAQVYHVTR